MRKPITMLVFALLIAVGAIGCSDDEGTQEITPAEAEVILETVVIPALHAPVFIVIVPGSNESLALGAERCETTSCPFGGTVVGCPGVITWNQCDIGDGISLDGALLKSVDGKCLKFDYDQLTIFSPGASATIDGPLEKCGDQFPEGVLEIMVMNSNGAFLFVLTHDASSPDIQVGVFDLSGNLKATCTINENEEATCV